MQTVFLQIHNNFFKGEMNTMATANSVQSTQRVQNPSLQQKLATDLDTEQLIQSEESGSMTDELEESDLEAVSGGIFAYLG
jgi:hypothetical protein